MYLKISDSFPARQLGLTRGSGGQKTIGSAGYLKMNLGMRDGKGFGWRIGGTS